MSACGELACPELVEGSIGVGVTVSACPDSIGVGVASAAFGSGVGVTVSVGAGVSVGGKLGESVGAGVTVASCANTAPGKTNVYGASDCTNIDNRATKVNNFFNFLIPICKTAYNNNVSLITVA